MQIRYPYKDNFTLYAYQSFTAYTRLAHAVFKTLEFIILHVHKLYRLVQYFASLWYFVTSSSSFGVFYLQIYLDIEV